jgi:hypothetical protein
VGVEETSGEEGVDGRVAGLGIEIARHDDDGVIGRVLACELHQLTPLAGVQHLVDLARGRAGRAIARTIVAAAGEVARHEVDHADGCCHPHPQRRAQRTGEARAVGPEHGEAREHDLAIETWVVVPHDPVLAAAHVGCSVLQERHGALVRLLHADELWALLLLELLEEERHPGRQIAAIRIRRARDPVEEVLADHPHARWRRGGCVRIVAGAAGRHDDEGRQHPPPGSHLHGR